MELNVNLMLNETKSHKEIFVFRYVTLIVAEI
jgi:hypothetical protein